MNFESNSEHPREPHTAWIGRAPELHSRAEAEAFAEQMAALAQAGLPLGPALRAAAAETPNRRVTRAFLWMAEQLDAGRSLAEVLTAHPKLLPPHLRQLIIVGVGSKNLGDVLVQLVEIDRAADEVRRTVRLALAYPAVLSVCFFAIAALLIWYLIPGIVKYNDGFVTELPWQTRALMWFSTGESWKVLAIAVATVPMLFLVFRVSLSPAFRQRFLQGMSLFGPIVRWRNMAQWCRLLAVLVGQKLQLPDALTLAGSGTPDANLQAGSLRLSRQVAQGAALAEAIDDTPQIPVSLAPIVRWGEQTQDLAGALRVAGEMYADRCRLRTGILQAVLPPLFSIAMAGGILFLVSALLAPIVALIRALTTFSFSTADDTWLMISMIASLGTVVSVGFILIFWNLIRTSSRKYFHRRAALLGRCLKAGARGFLWLVLSISLGVFFWLISGVTGLVIWVGAMIVLIVTTVFVRQSDLRTLQWTLATAGDRGLPLAAAARAFSQERGDKLGRKADRLATYLEDGMALEHALDRAGIRLPTDALLAVRLASVTGQMGDSLRRTADDAAELMRFAQVAMGKLLYLTLFISFAGLTIGFFYIKIAPALFKISEDFNTEHSGSLNSLRKIYETLQPLAPFVALIPVIAFLLIILSLLRFSAVIRWDPPLVRRLWRPLDQALVLRSLASAVERHVPWQRTLEMLATQYPKAHIRHDLAFTQQCLQRGAPWDEALCRGGLLRRRDADVLLAAERVGNLSWALHETADRASRRFVARLTGWLGVLFPVVLAVVAVAAFALALYTFMFQVELLESLA